MKTVVKWADMKKVGVSRWLWRRAKTRMKPIDRSQKLWRAEEVARVLGLPPEVFERMK